MEKPNGAEYGRSLTGFGINILVTNMANSIDFVRDVLGLNIVYWDEDFAIVRHQMHEFMMHADPTYEENALLEMTGDGAIRGVGIELRLYGVDPDKAVNKATEGGFHILQQPINKEHGLREAYIIGPDNYVWVPSAVAEK